MAVLTVIGALVVTVIISMGVMAALEYLRKLRETSEGEK